MFFIRQDAELTSDGTYSLYAELSSDIDGDAFWLTMSGTGSADYVVPGIFLEMDDYREMFEYAYDPSGMFAVTFEGEQTYNGETQKISGYAGRIAGDPAGEHAGSEYMARRRGESGACGHCLPRLLVACGRRDIRL
jgi:hypothetical protein